MSYNEIIEKQTHVRNESHGLSRQAFYMVQRKEEVNEENSRNKEQIQDRFCVTNSELHRFFGKQLSLNINAGRPHSPLLRQRGRGQGWGPQ
jgi:hypothetical protein